ncbi:MAG: rhodanese-like domain-containing protein [Campylobacterales bacterium]|jgi:rhodanese-related sulfurtransferase
MEEKLVFLEEVIRQVKPENMKKFRIGIEEFLKLYREGRAVLLDVREEYETRRWGLNFGLQIPVSQLPDRLGELPSDKIVVTICPGRDRSNIASLYLKSKGFESRYLADGLLGLTAYLRGSVAKEFPV